MMCRRCRKRQVGSPLHALERKERAAREEGFCTAKCKIRDELFKELSDPFWVEADRRFFGT